MDNCSLKTESTTVKGEHVMTMSKTITNIREKMMSKIRV